MSSLISRVRAAGLVAITMICAQTGSIQAQVPAAQPAARPDIAWRERYAYRLAVQAHVSNFQHFRKLADASYCDAGFPNQDTVYSIAWVDVRKEPVILVHPETSDRYFTFEPVSLDSDNFAYVGKRTTGGKAGHSAIIGPGWKGTRPDGVRTFVGGPAGVLPEPRMARPVELFASIGIGPNLDVDKIDAGTKRALERAVANGRKMLD